MTHTRRAVLSSPDVTDAAARWLAPHLRAGDVILMAGPVGAGKTHFARAIIQTLQAAVGMAEDVPSPTFTLVQTYIAGELEVWHADLYRLSHPDDVLELGLEDAFTTALCLIEWPDRLSAPPPGALHITFGYVAGQEDARQCDLSSDADRWATIIAEFPTP